MGPLKYVEGLVAPLDRVNVDTDQIIPKEFLKLTDKTGYGQYLFFNWRLDAAGNPRHDFTLNEPRYHDAKILLTRANFGCGSSREHAVWALQQYGFKAILAPSFADIFYGNCFKNGLLPITLEKPIIERLFHEVAEQDGYSLEIDLPTQTMRKPNRNSIHFDIDSFRKKCLLEGIDEIEMTLSFEDQIRAYEGDLRPFQMPNAGTAATK
jgi:3-isopropylmalate/(R)-2-methylmalate dehydratase small subunit